MSVSAVHHFLLLAVALVTFAATLLPLPPAGAEDTILAYKCGGVPAAANASSDAYRSNLNALAATLVAGARANGSAVAAVGAPPDAAYGVALCRGDFTGDACARGLGDALRSAVNDSESAFGCGRQARDVTLFYDRYQLRLAGVDFLSGDDGDEPRWAGIRTNFVTPADAAVRFDGLVKELVTAIAGIAAGRPDRYATGRSRFGEQRLTLYGLVQCTVDMPPERCRACLDGLISAFPATFRPSGQHGGRILVPRCTVRYETDDTFFNTANLSVDLHKPKRTYLLPFLPTKCLFRIYHKNKCLFRMLLKYILQPKKKYLNVH